MSNCSLFARFLSLLLAGTFLEAGASTLGEEVAATVPNRLVAPYIDGLQIRRVAASIRQDEFIGLKLSYHSQFTVGELKPLLDANGKLPDQLSQELRWQFRERNAVARLADIREGDSPMSIKRYSAGIFSKDNVEPQTVEIAVKARDVDRVVAKLADECPEFFAIEAGSLLQFNLNSIASDGTQEAVSAPENDPSQPIFPAYYSSVTLSLAEAKTTFGSQSTHANFVGSTTNFPTQPVVLVHDAATLGTLPKGNWVLTPPDPSRLPGERLYQIDLAGASPIMILQKLPSSCRVVRVAPETGILLELNEAEKANGEKAGIRFSPK